MVAAATYLGDINHTSAGPAHARPKSMKPDAFLDNQARKPYQNEDRRYKRLKVHEKLDGLFGG
jgi:hypothetical protein